MTTFDLDTLVTPPQGGPATWHLDSLWTWKVPAELSGGAFSLAEQLLPRGSAPPVHSHSHEDEAWLVLDGELSFYLAGEERRVGAGTCVFGPRGTAHTFLVRSETARMLTLLTPGSAEGFFHATGRPAEARTLPPPEAPDMPALVAAMGDYGIELVGAPPQL